MSYIEMKNKEYKNNLIKAKSYRGMSLCTGRGNYPIDMRVDYLDKILKVMKKANEEYPRTMILRVDLKFPKTKIYEKEGVIKRFVESLRSQIDAEISRKRKHGRRTSKCTVRYVWTKERDSSINYHYHVGLFFNKDVYAFLGNMEMTGNLAYKVKKAWCSALELEMEDGVGLVEFPKNRIYWLIKNSLDYEYQFDNAFRRLSYFAKVRTKVLGEGNRNFGCSLK